MDWLNDVIAFAGPCWIVNMFFNLLYPLKTFFPKVAALDTPLDFGKFFFDGRRILGGSACLSSIALVLIMPFFLTFIFDQSYALLLLKAACVFFGDAAGSFIKRRFGVPRGRFLPFVDHGDYIWATGVVFLLAGNVSFETFLIALTLTYTFHPIVCVMAYALKIRKDPV